MSNNVVFDGLPSNPNDNQIAEDLQGIHSEDPLFSNDVRQLISAQKPDTHLETSSSDFDKIKELVITHHNLKEFITDIENKFSNNIDKREEEIKEWTSELKELKGDLIMAPAEMDVNGHKFPFSIVWTPLPLISYIIPIIGHMGICTSKGVIRDFAGPYHVSEDNMAFGWPTKYVKLNPNLANRGVQGWDEGVTEASEIYKYRTHNLFCDNCHSHVATALNLMNYNGQNDWNMVKVAVLITFKSKYVGFSGFLKQWVPFGILIWFITMVYYLLRS